MDKKPVISIVTVSYNSVHTIEKTIQSVISQPYPYKEYIIVDGGSIDGTVDIIRKYEDSIAYWISEPDSGIYNAMNKAIEIATGELIAFLGSDDWYDKDILEDVVEKYVKSCPDLIYGNITFVDKTGEKKLDFKDINLQDIYYGMQFGHPSCFVRTKLQKKYRFDETYCIAADYKFCMQLYRDGYRFEHIDKNISYFALGGASSRILETAEETRRASYEVLADNIAPFREKVDRTYRQKVIWILLERELKTVKGKQLLRDLINVRDDLYIFGTGDVGKHCLEALCLIGIKVRGFLDNSENRQKEGFKGYSVYSPGCIQKISSGTVFIGSIMYADEMEKQLLDMKLPESIKLLKCENVFQRVIDQGEEI